MSHLDKPHLLYHFHSSLHGMVDLKENNDAMERIVNPKKLYKPWIQLLNCNIVQLQQTMLDISKLTLKLLRFTNWIKNSSFFSPCISFVHLLWFQILHTYLAGYTINLLMKETRAFFLQLPFHEGLSVVLHSTIQCYATKSSSDTFQSIHSWKEDGSPCHSHAQGVHLVLL